MGVDNGLVIFLPHVSDFQAPFSQCDFPSCFCWGLGLVLAGSGNQVGDGTLASMLVPGCHSQFCRLSYALLLSEPIINEIMTVETFNTLKMCLKIYVQTMLNLTIFSAVICQVIRKFKIYSHKATILFVVKNKELFTTNQEIHNINTRCNKNLHPPVSNLAIFQKGVYFSGIKLFNHLPPNIKIISN